MERLKVTSTQLHNYQGNRSASLATENITDRLDVVGNMYGLMRTYYIRPNFFSIDNKFTVYENGQVQYEVRGGVLLGGVDNLTLEDRFGRPLVRIQQAVGHFLHPTFELFSADGRPLARIRKRFLRSKFDIDTVYGPYRLEMLFRERGLYGIWNAQNQMIAEGKTAFAKVAANQNQAFVLALLTVINQYIKPSPPAAHIGYGH